jgi:DNA-directed RNA polymerase sigma subunit (sigma70/sigma32)
MKHREHDGVTSCPKVAKLLAIKEAEELVGQQLLDMPIDDAVNLLVITAQSILLSEERVRQIEKEAFAKVRGALACRHVDDLFAVDHCERDEYEVVT